MFDTDVLPRDAKEKLQRLLDLTASLERVNSKVLHGLQPTTEDFLLLGEGRREFGDLIALFGLRPPGNSSS
ncbi:hypothetical protein [Pseudomonas veronii]|uniref:hypothetical protein n=1 Tax=Pseudomonas veronii TaxID=76761 RepID=UPI0021BFAE2B|nr:hypothetical protein [Pseudomonas veronii]MCT9825975.1 hypothetical protein [Pseudomonas veronii]